MAEPCIACGGRGTVSFGTEDMKCDTCDGKGTLPPKQAKQAEKAHEERQPEQA